ncbi:hypothetical protein CEUSTIGMA_g11528.t1 [Chlamydomonas eustigma]|uniref:MalT-like TPR region domain-containing protein n=1 Tax=Chlamydomonas eustigma TaxID=1157962 RepID=A0A250XLX3_9CHLO|nr:hypothetical protein CEUSTIGMA_g11528.t1 [Chlamydomonas eustigma]|eukprot:GAX84105.1 hypothetical protein CEUSTIGMA_g11528.t1 [Chlamydomonas eustigma]
MGFLPKLGRHEERIIRNRSLSGEKPISIDENVVQLETAIAASKSFAKISDAVKPLIRARALTRMITKQQFEDVEIQSYILSASNLDLKTRFEGQGEEEAPQEKMSLHALRRKSMSALPKIRNRTSTSGFLDADQAESVASSSSLAVPTAMQQHRPSAVLWSQDGSGKVSTSQLEQLSDVKQHTKLPKHRMSAGALENDMMRIASNFGLVPSREVVNGNREQSAPKYFMKSSEDNIPRSRSHSRSGTATVFQLSPMGIQLSVLLNLAANVPSATMSIAEVIKKHIAPPTAQLRCRYVDVISEKLTADVPQYVISFSPSLSFHTLVNTLSKYFELNKLKCSDVYVWVDFLNVNQHSRLVASDVDDLVQILNSVEKVLLVLDRAGVALSSTRVLFEALQATAAQPTQPDSKKKPGKQWSNVDKLVVLPVSYAWNDARHAFVTLPDLGTSVCSKEHGEKDWYLERMARIKSNESASSSSAKSVKETLVMAAKREMQRSERLASINPLRYVQAATTYAMLLYLQYSLSEAEEILHTIKILMDKNGSRDFLDKVEPSYLLHLSLIMREKGQLAEAHRALQVMPSHMVDSSDEIFVDGSTSLVEILTESKQFTKAELLCRKILDTRERACGHHKSAPAVVNMIQLAFISEAQSLYEEAEERANAALRLISQLDGITGLTASACFHILACSCYNTHREEQADKFLDKALAIRLSIMGPHHPLTLESMSLRAVNLAKRKQVSEARSLVSKVHSSRMLTYGLQHVESLKTLGYLADLLRLDGKLEEAEEAEKLLGDAGKSLLKCTRIDKFQSLQYVSAFLSTREHLLDKAAPFLAKAFVTFKEKLGSESEMTVSTVKRLEDVITRESALAAGELETAQLYNLPEKYQAAQVLYKQAWSLAKLIHPEESHKEVAEGLADALFGQGKAMEAKTVLKAAGLVKKGMSDNMPASYLRWLNKRVAKYMDKGLDEKTETPVQADSH